MHSAINGVFTKNDYAYFRLRELIITGELQPGAPLRQGRLADSIGVSTTPLREAIRRLAAEGLIDLAAHRDAKVSEATPEEAANVLEVRLSLDPLAASLAAGNRTDGELATIIEAERKLIPLTNGDGIDALMAHRDFHRSIYAASHNEVLIDMLERLWDKADRYRMIGLRSRDDSAEETSRVAMEHHNLVLAITDSDTNRAGELMAEHIHNSLGKRAITALDRD